MENALRWDYSRWHPVPGLPGYCSHRTLQGLPYGHSLQKKVEKNVKKELTKDRLCVILTKSVAGVRKQAQPVRNGILAQLGEHLPYKQRVIGSSPIGPILYSCIGQARVAEQADAQDLKSCCGNTVPVRFRSRALIWRSYQKKKEYVCVAQLDRALGYGPRCRGFESSHAR